ncbi:spore germination protein [Paenibacillus sp. J2TS4]|uniref:spore germination protein n=1 Tax=Paenibacillus sp. J2TS4 TaxID=2807194 RepID=UPI001B294952|nr:spore germination protein [Paenibacillus sp. J2TS4]GIP34750.1 putative membrane protein YfkQ [Paenibacillus sp. J2TS4]
MRRLFRRNRKLFSSPLKPERMSPIIPKRDWIGMQGIDEPQGLGSALKPRLLWFHERLDRCFDAMFHSFTAMPDNRPCVCIYLRGMVDFEMFQQYVLQPLTSPPGGGNSLTERIFENTQLPSASYSTIFQLKESLNAVLEGNILLLIDGEERMASFPYILVEKRPIEEAKNETVIRGPREGFVEHLETNLSLMRRRIKSPFLKMEHYQIGSHTQTDVVISYLEGICTQQLVDEVRTRLSRIVIDGVLDTSYIEEFLEDSPSSPFPQLQYTERPDTAAAALLEGRVVIFVDGTPNPLIAPVTLFALLQSAEDYYQRFYAASWIRWIRYILMIASLLLPSLYIAITTFHPETLPSNLLVSVAAAREAVPFPAVVEAFLMELTFEGLREAGLRIPKPIGQAVSILGGLVIGQAAVQAGIVSAPMVIIVSLTGVASFVIPHFDLGLTLRFLRFPIMILASTLGLFGVVCGLMLIYLHLTTLRSFGTPYLSPIAPMHTHDMSDVFIRAPWWRMRSRPYYYATDANKQRLQYVDRMKRQEED